MSAKLEDLIGLAADSARSRARGFPGAVRMDDLPWAVIEAYDRDVRRHVARDRRIEDERDRVLIAAVTLAETPADETEAIRSARDGLIDAIDFLEEAARCFGMAGRRDA